MGCSRRRHRAKITVKLTKDGLPIETAKNFPQIMQFRVNVVYNFHVRHGRWLAEEDRG